MRKIFMNVEDYLDIVMYGNPEYEGLSEEVLAKVRERLRADLGTEEDDDGKTPDRNEPVLGA